VETQPGSVEAHQRLWEMLQVLTFLHFKTGNEQLFLKQLNVVNRKHITEWNRIFVASFKVKIMTPTEIK
jgi:hypothetical protein